MNYEKIKKAYSLLKTMQIVFWDFDGVIKDSVVVKSKGYQKLFLPFGEGVAKRVNQHHQAHGGVSRYEKIPLYLNWAGESANHNQVEEFCDRFSKLVQQAVVASPWVPGVYEYLRSNFASQCFILNTGTPQEEIEQILDALGITHYFREVHGAPKDKTQVVSDVLKRMNCPAKQALLIGDAETDHEAAKENNIAFLLRCTQQNHSLQGKYSGPRFESLKNE